jgi:hypothetical protein
MTKPQLRLAAAGGALLVLLAALVLFPRMSDGDDPTMSGALDGPDHSQGVIFWSRCDHLLELTDAELDSWKQRGVSGFSCATPHLSGLGGSQEYTGDPDATLTGRGYDLQRRIRSSRIVPRIHGRGMKMYFGFYVADYERPVTPYGDWFDDGQWNSTVLPSIRAAAAMAKTEGFDGVTLDQEDYPGKGGKRHSWAVDYPGSSHPEGQVRDKVRERGREVMQAILQGFPDVIVNAYYWNFPGGWGELVKHEVGGLPPENASRLVHLEFWDGMTSVPGYRAVRFLDSTFYKGIHLSGTWDTAFQYNTNRLYATFSRRFSGWDYAASRVHVQPFAWVDHTHEEWPYVAREPKFVEEQLSAYRRWTTDGEFFNFVFNTPLSKYDYSPYFTALRSASEPGPVDTTPPTLTVAPTSAGSPTVTLAGSATDNLAIRSVRWQTDRGHSGEARLTWVVESGNYREGYRWRMDWVAEGVPKDRSVTLVATDVKGLEATHTVRF